MIRHLCINQEHDYKHFFGLVQLLLVMRDLACLSTSVGFVSEHLVSVLCDDDTFQHF